MLTTRPIQPGSDRGVEVLGLDLARETAQSTRRELIHLFHQHQVIRISGQAMNLHDYARFGAWFGNPHPHAVEKVRVAGFPGVTLLTNADDETRNTAAYWHTDNTYEAEPATATMLWAEIVPDQGGETMFADMYSAYTSLPDAMKRRIGNMRSLNGWFQRKRSANPSFINEGKLRLSRHRKLTNEGIAEWIENELSVAWRRSGRTGALA